jgi:hypothetical protein
MKFYRMVLSIFLLAGLSATASHADKLPQFGTPTQNQFQDYWYNHGAELSRFSLRQMRYGEIHEGDAVLEPYWKLHSNKDRRRLEGLGLSAREMGGK